MVILLSDLLPTYFLRLLFWYILCQESRRPLMTQFCNFLCNYINSLFSDRKCYGNKLFNCLTNHKWSFQEERKKNVFLFFMNYIPLYAICTNKVNKRFCHFMITYKKKASLSLFFFYMHGARESYDAADNGDCVFVLQFLLYGI